MELKRELWTIVEVTQLQAVGWWLDVAAFSGTSLHVTVAVKSSVQAEAYQTEPLAVKQELHVAVFVWMSFEVTLTAWSQMEL
jgi:hypothetical protein